jgi:hypothetical protein
MIGLHCGGGGEMKRLLVVMAAMMLAGALVSAARAQGPTHFKETFSDSFVSPAGERCDFEYQISFTVVIHDIVFGDVDDPTKLISQVTAHVTHTNLETGYALTEVDRTIQTLDFQAGVGKTVGIIWKLRTPEGKLVFVQVGQVTYTLEGEVLKITPHLLPEDTAPIVCGLLGGHAA